MVLWYYIVTAKINQCSIYNSMGIHILNYDKQILGQNADLGHVVEVCYGLSLLHILYIFCKNIYFAP